MPLLLYYHPNWSYMNYHKPSLEFLSFIVTAIHYPYYSPSIFSHIHFIPTLSVCFLVIVGFFYMDQSYLLTLGTSYYPLMYVQLMLSFSIEVDVLPVPVLYIFITPCTSSCHFRGVAFPVSYFFHIQYYCCWCHSCTVRG